MPFPLFLHSNLMLLPETPDWLLPPWVCVHLTTRRGWRGNGLFWDLNIRFFLCYGSFFPRAHAIRITKSNVKQEKLIWRILTHKMILSCFYRNLSLEDYLALPLKTLGKWIFKNCVAKELKVDYKLRLRENSFPFISYKNSLEQLNLST